MNETIKQIRLMPDDEIYDIQADPTRTATSETGSNVIELFDSADAPLVKCSTAITGSQNLHGYDKPWVGGANINKMPPGEAKTETINGVTCTSDGNGIYTFAGTCTQDFEVTFDCDEFTIPSADNSAFYLFNTQSNSSTTFVFYKDSTMLDTWVLAGLNRVSIYNTLKGLLCNKYGMRLKDGVTYNLTIKPMLAVGTSYTAWTPYSNICPITAYTEGEIEVGKAGSIYDDANIIGQNAGSSVTSQDDSLRVYRVAEANYVSSKQLLSNYTLVNGKTYTVLAYAKITSGTANIAIRNAQNNVVEQSGNATEDGWAKLSFTYNSSWTGYYLSFFAAFNEASGGDVKYSNIRFVEGDLLRHTTTYPSAIYRGSEDVVNENVECIEKIFTISSVTLYGTYGDDNANLYYADIADNVCAYAVDGMTYKPISNKYNAITTAATTGMKNGEFRTQGGIGTLYSNRFYFRDDRYTDATDFNADLANNPIVIAARLYTPTTSSVTPTNLPIRTLSGYNHIESSTGDMEVEYITEGYQPLVDMSDKVKQTATSTNANYEVLLSGTADNTTRTEGTNKSENLTFNPDSGELTATKLTGNIKGNELSSSQITSGLGYVPVNVNSPKVANVNDTIVKRDSNGGIFGNMNGLYNKFYAYNSVPSDATSYKALIDNRPEIAICKYAELGSNTTLPIAVFPASHYAYFYCVAFDQLQGNISHFAFKAFNTGIVNIHNDATGLSALVGDYNPNKNEKLVSLKTEQNYSYFVWLWMV